MAIPLKFKIRIYRSCGSGLSGCADVGHDSADPAAWGHADGPRRRLGARNS